MMRLELGERLYRQFVPPVFRERMIAEEITKIGTIRLVLAIENIADTEGTANVQVTCKVLTSREIANLIAYYALTHEYERRRGENEND